MTKVVVVGAGAWGKNLVRNFHELGILLGVCDKALGPEGTGAGLHVGVPPFGLKSYSNLDQVLGDTDSDTAIVIATPAETHFVLAKQALLAGRDVFVEKPLTLKEYQAVELVELAEAEDKILMVGHIMEYHPAFQKLVEIVREGRIGNVLHIYSNRLSFGKVRKEENVVWSFAPHDISMVLRVAGIQDEVNEAKVLNVVTEQVVSHHEDIASFSLDFPFVSSRVNVSWCNPFKEHKFVVLGDDGQIVFDDTNKFLGVYDKYITAGEIMNDSGGSDYIYFPKDEPLRKECEAFIHSIETRKQPIADGKSAIRVVDILERIQHDKNW